ncbi:FHA domain-containing protein [Thermaurantimonas aggregans]|uniref:FHA domain-containing protein n=1 Tax=Thermaurantimonas aggregans TaxID=2173829 RepID=UPI0023EF7482|nr:FHA domain-containing protein [Thermaurantimonas aggregans]MCX8148077.1 FHA domain-containing protein [Thermaurantimonas aggregans]
MTDKPVRCPNCGYANEPRNHRCKRCNYPLREEDSSMPSPSPSSAPVNATVVGKSANIDPWDMDNSRPVSQQLPPQDPPHKAPANAAAPAEFSAPSPKARKLEVNKTIDPSRMALFEKNVLKLVRIPKEGEKEATLEFEGEKIILTRDNTDPGNMTITSREQAALEYKDGKWMLSDRSALQTTYIRVNQPTELKNGDVILLGNRAFRVEF